MFRANISSLLYLIVFAPLAGSIINGLLSRYLPRKAVSVIGVGAPFISFAATLVAGWGFLGLQAEDPAFGSVTATLFNWISSGPVDIDFALYLDPLSLVMTLVVTCVGSFIHMYSIGYMHGDPSYARYFSHLNLFMFAMLLLVLGRSLLLLFVGWEGVGLCSYLLIGFWFSDMDKASAGKKAFIVNRIGDFGFLLALFVLLFWLGGSLDVPDLKQMVTEPGSALAAKTGLLTVVTLCLFLGATGKSAQIPLYVWLPDAMAGPTPVSALIHAATMVTAGVYMIARLNFLFALAPVTMAIVAGVGALTALLAATIGLTQFDIKKVLAYSTVSQLGYMFLGVGMGAFGAGIFHLMTHAFFKACLFLCAGSVIHAMNSEQDIRKMGGLGKYMPITRATFLISTMAIAGVPLLSGFFSKDEILYNAFVLNHASGTLPPWLGKLYFAMGLFAALLTAIYMFRLYFLTFTGELRSRDAHPHESPWSMTVPLMVLAFGAIVVGYVGLPDEKLNVFHHFLEPVFEHGMQHIVSTGTHALEYGLMGLSTVVAVGGIVIAWLLYRGPWQDEPANIARSLSGLYRLVFDKYRMDELYGAVFVRPVQAVARWSYKWLDAGAIDGVMVNGSAKTVRGIGTVTRWAVNGDVQSYATAVFMGLVVLVYLIF